METGLLRMASGGSSPHIVPLHEQSTLISKPLIVAPRPSSGGLRGGKKKLRRQVVSQKTTPSASGDILPGQAQLKNSRESSFLVSQSGQVFRGVSGPNLSSQSGPQTIERLVIHGSSPAVLEEPFNFVSSTQAEEEEEVEEEEVRSGAEKLLEIRALKYRKKYQAKKLESYNVKVRLAERERQLEVANQDIGELQRKLREADRKVRFLGYEDESPPPERLNRRRGIQLIEMLSAYY